MAWLIPFCSRRWIAVLRLVLCALSVTPAVAAPAAEEKPRTWSLRLGPQIGTFYPIGGYQPIGTGTEVDFGLTLILSRLRCPLALRFAFAIGGVGAHAMFLKHKPLALTAELEIRYGGKLDFVVTPTAEAEYSGTDFPTRRANITGWGVSLGATYAFRWGKDGA